MGSLAGGEQSATHPDALLQFAKSPPDEELPLDDELEAPEEEELDALPEDDDAGDPEEALELAPLDAELVDVPGPVLAVLAEPPEAPPLPALVLAACDDPQPRAAALSARTTARFRWRTMA
jgi:hypothetical protein